MKFGKLSDNLSRSRKLLLSYRILILFQTGEQNMVQYFIQQRIQKLI